MELFTYKDASGHDRKVDLDTVTNATRSKVHGVEFSLHSQPRHIKSEALTLTTTLKEPLPNGKLGEVHQVTGADMVRLAARWGLDFSSERKPLPGEANSPEAIAAASAGWEAYRQRVCTA